MKTDAEIYEEIAGVKRDTEKRREMTSGQVKKTLQGDIKFILKVDLPVAISDDDFKRYMVEYGNIISEAFSAK